MVTVVSIFVAVYDIENKNGSKPTTFAQVNLAREFTGGESEGL